MRARRASNLLALLVLLSPLAALAVPACAPGQHCPMAGAMGDGPPCHGTSIQADNCCLTSVSAEPAEVVPVTAAAALATDDGVLAPRAEPGEGVCPAARDHAPSPPLYRLFRTLLI
jgi:hypothetical protein